MQTYSLDFHKQKFKFSETSHYCLTYRRHC